MFKNLSIRTKLALTLLLVGILSISITGWLCYLNSKSTLEKAYTNNLTSIRETKKQQIETYFNQIRDQIITFSEDQMIVDAMKQFRTAFYSVKKNNVFANTQILHYALSVRDYYKNEYLARLNPNVINKRKFEQYSPDNDATIILQYHYIVNNQNPIGFKDNLDMATDGSRYSHIHSKYHSIIRNYQRKFGYYDIFLVDPETGRIVYSVFKEVDYATSLLTGPYKDTNIARLFKEIQNAPDKEFVKLVDFEFYGPSRSDPASFIASPIFDEDKQIGVLIFQVPIDEINQVMTGDYNWENEGLGESGETYIAGSDYKMRNDSRFLIEEPARYFELIEQAGTDKELINQIKLHSTSIMFQNLDTEAVEDALNGNTNTRIINDYRGVPVLSSYTPLNIEDVNWVILSEIDKEEAFASLDVIRDRIIFIILIFSALVAIIAFLISKNISRTIIKLVNSMDSVSKGDLSKRVNIARKDEIGKLIDTFNKMADNLVEANINKEQALMESKRAREYSENLVKTAQDAIICINEDGVVNVWNKAAEKIFGYSEREISGELITTIIPERYKTQHEEGLRRFLHTSEARIIGRTVEVSGITKEGIEVPIEMSLAFQENEKGDYSFTAIIRDITERMEAEERLQLAKEAAEVANKAKSEFLATMSHEIRTPMNGVMGMTELILDTDLTSEQRECVETVYSSADSLLTIINDILDFSKIESGKLEMEHIDFDLCATVDDIIDIFSARTDEEGLEFSCFIDPEIPSLLRGDPGRLRQVLINLAGNAIKFTNNDGEVAVSLTAANETDTHATIRFDIRDTGIGIPADRKNRLFKSFSQIDASTTRKYGGTGLGLAISKQIVELMGGQIGVESEEGRGSTFWFTVVLEKQSPEHQVRLELGDIENLRVLVVDDNSTNRHIIRKYLESWHCRVEEAASAEEAMGKLRAVAVDGSDPFQIGLLDYHMPEIDGKALGKEIKASPQLKELILVILTSVGERGDAECFQKMGFAAYLLKPVKQEQLFNCLRIVTGGSASDRKDSSRQIVTRHTISEDHKLQARILLAEDNIVNQKIALRILEKKLGLHVDVVNNGEEALESLKRLDYDLVLMDCQMPEMDGYEATRAIRDLNSTVRNHKISIVAMTAHAMKGDREKCLEAGMDDYVTKPINMKKLADAIERNIVKKE